MGTCGKGVLVAQKFLEKKSLCRVLQPNTIPEKLLGFFVLVIAALLLTYVLVTITCALTGLGSSPDTTTAGLAVACPDYAAPLVSEKQSR